MSLLASALDLSRQGFYVFPLIPNSKLPLIKDYTGKATRNEETIKKWWTCPVMGIELAWNIGIATSRFGDDKALVVVDVDKHKHDGFLSLLSLELEGREFPPTYTHTTPSGGEHLVYVHNYAVKQGSHVLGPGLDIRSHGGLIVGAGSIIDGVEYKVSTQGPPEECPQFILDICQKEKEPLVFQQVDDIDQEFAAKRAEWYLKNVAPIAEAGAGGDETTYTVACRLRDYGVDSYTCYELLLDHWNDRCEPPWSPEEIVTKIENAYRYAKNPLGIDSPQADFLTVKEQEKLQKIAPMDLLNKAYAFVISGGGHHILWETKDINGNPTLAHLNELSFHRQFANNTITTGDGETKPLSQLWMKSPKRRSYHGFCFRPERKTPPEFYNLWRGFAVEPSEKGSPEAHDSLKKFLEHALESVCGGSTSLFEWLIGYFAHLMQKPWEKPLTALVFRGEKGVGKNALVERISFLLGHHALLTDDSRYILGNFNAHLEHCLLLILDEAFWSGDKKAEAKLKNLITGKSHVIERKGKESYTVENCTRVIIIGNNEWLVPASQDERRFAVFDVGNERKQNTRYFQSMREGMERGGYRLLLRYLQAFDLSKVDINVAPMTKALGDQKILSLEPFGRWWHECLTQRHIVGSEFEEWQPEVKRSSFRDAFLRYCRNEGIRTRAPGSTAVGHLVKKYVPHVSIVHQRNKGERHRVYWLGELADCQKQWEKITGHQGDWS